MAMVCPQCSQSFEKHLLCPACGGRLVYQASLNATAADTEAPWQQTPWGRLLVGLLLAQGLAHGLRLITTAGIIVWDDDGKTVWSTLLGLVLWHVLQGVSLIFGGALAGAGQARGILYGAIIGFINGLIFLAFQQRTDEYLTPIAMYGQPVLHVAFGALGGLIGTIIWKPLPTVQLAVAPEDQGKGPARLRQTQHAFSGPVAWVRVLAGCAIVVAGTVWSQSILKFVLDASQGKLSINSHLQAQLVSLEIAALVTLCGAGLAGATTRNGMKQGLCVGMGASIVLIGIQLGNPKTTFEGLVIMLGNIFGLTLVGGWFGGQLFPPILAAPRHRVDSMI